MILKRVLVANRGEIAIRILKTLKKLHIGSVLVYHQSEEQFANNCGANFKVCIGNGTLAETFLNIDKLIEVALTFQVDAVHPGYGFLSENSNFALQCKKNSLLFIGPPSHVIANLGNKTKAKQLAEKAGVPVLSSIHPEVVKSGKVKFPLLIKAAAGGGGRGMRIARHINEFDDLLQSAQKEAEAFFGDGQVFVEPFLENTKHIEVQIMADNHGNVVDLFTRDCSTQRNNQKIIEEAPALAIPNELNNQIRQLAVNFAREAGYVNAGTVEFLVSNNRCYFLEMNTRLQVEHPVTEAITGLDLVQEQLNVAANNKLPNYLYNINPVGHAIEVRLCAEKPFDNFLPSSGSINKYFVPNNVRFDTYIDKSPSVNPLFDSLIGKIIVKGANRTEALQKLRQTLKECFFSGVETNLPLLQILAENADFSQNKISTTYLEALLPSLSNIYLSLKQNTEPSPYLAAYLSVNLLNTALQQSHWQSKGFFYRFRNVKFKIDNQLLDINLKEILKNQLKFELNQTEYTCNVLYKNNNTIELNINGSMHKLFYCVSSGGQPDIYQHNGIQKKLLSLIKIAQATEFISKAYSAKATEKEIVKSPLFGKVLHININKNDKIAKGDVILSIESMKTENKIMARAAGIVEQVFVEQGEQIKEHTKLVTINYKFE